MVLRAKIDKILSITLIVIMSVMVINVVWQVFTRYVTSSPSSFTDELARYLMIWLSLLGAAYVAGKNMHVAIDIIPSRLTEEKRKRLGLVVHALIIIFAILVMVIGGSRLVYITYYLEQFSPSLQIPLAVVYSVIPISGLLIIYYKLSDILN